MNYDERLEQVRKNQQLLKEEEQRLLKVKELQEEKKFYLGEIYTAKDGDSFILVRDSCKKIILVRTNGFYKGRNLKYNDHKVQDIKVKRDSTGYYVNRLPTIYPDDFGLERKYGV